MALFMWRGTGSAYAVPVSVLSGGAPSLADITDPDTVDLTDALTAVSGFDSTPNNIATPVLRSKTPIQIPGEVTLGNPVLTLVDDPGEDDAATARQRALDELQAGTEWTLVFFMNTQEPDNGDRGYYIPVTVSNQVPTLSLDAVAATIAINCAAKEELAPFVLGAAS